MSGSNANQLKNETSSYLKRHIESPVNWHSYGPEALQKAVDEKLPIFISIGYNSCHWCHQMQDECFSDEEVAAMLNKNYINIKIDREELPDLDQYYQLASQAMNGRGGWPLNIFLTPKMQPYFIGTYFPKYAANELPSFLEVISNMSKAFQNEIENVTSNANQITEALRQPPQVKDKVEFPGHYPAPNSILNALKNYQDDEAGGYGAEPKFPHYAFYEWAVEQMLEGMVSEEFGKHILKSIEAMMMGGLYDHARGGVHRYCSDKNYQLPHFEKMLFDQAALLRLLVKTSLVYPAPLIFDGLIQTLDYLDSEMLSENGYFFSGQDARSEGHEGLYYTFTRDEFIDALIQFDENLIDDQDKILSWFDIKEDGNFQNTLNTIHLNPKLKNDFYSPEGWTLVRKVRQALVEARKLRIPPATDQKGIASWNFQLLTSLLEVVHYSKIESIKQAAYQLYLKSAPSIFDTFLYQNEQEKTRIQTSTTRTGHVPLFEDHVFFCELCFKTFEILGDSQMYENGITTLKYIFDEYFAKDIFHTRAISFNEVQLYDNISTPIFDQNYKAPLATLLTLLRKWSTVSQDSKDLFNRVQNIKENLTHLSLQNPLSFGESLRGLTYPDEAYRKVEIPHAWIKNNIFHPYISNFSQRFAINYHTKNEESWEIGNLTECEIRGEGIEEFKKIFSQL